MRLVAETLPEAVLCFMHPVKAEEAIAEAYFTHGVRTFILDTIEELEKIVARHRRRRATDLNLLVRLRVSSDHAKLSLAAKFGAEPHEMKAAADGRPPGVRRARHLLPRRQPGDDARPPMPRRWSGSAPRSSRRRSRSTSSMSAAAFPSCYPGMEPPPLETYFEVIHRAFEDLPISYSAELWCEPGRALCAEYASVLVRVEKRRGDELYINDGAYGALFDAAHIGWRFPVQLVREEASNARDDGVQLLRADLRRSRPYGGAVRCCPPTSQAGDYIEIGMLGAYGCAMRTGFNGFGVEDLR